MYTRTITLKFRKVILKFSESPFLEKNKSVVFGNPTNFQESDFQLDTFEFGNTVNGYWLKIDFYNDELKFTNDILGGYRVYYFKKKNEIYISDDYTFILNFYVDKLIKNEIEYQYWIKHGFTTGNSTFIQNLKKISPASILTITSDEIKEESYFKDFKRNSNIILHKEKVHKDLLNTFNYIKSTKQKVILLFSGGKDSCLLLQYLLKLDIQFTPVFFKLNPISKFGVEDLKRVRAVSKMLDLDLDEIEVNLFEITQKIKTQIVKKQLFDKHFSLLHYIGNKQLVSKYGNDCLIINGQSSDSILSFGPSEKSLMSFFRRHIMYNQNSIYSKVGLILLILKTKKRFKLPLNEKEKLFALFDEFKYTRVIDKSLGDKYYNYIVNYINNKTEHLTSYHSREMYTKILSFSQGSDNQVVVNSSKYYGLNTVMPFATPKIIYATVTNKDEKEEITNPKYVIEKILIEEFSFFYKDLKLESIEIDNLEVDSNGNASKNISELYINFSQDIFN